MTRAAQHPGPVVVAQGDGVLILREPASPPNRVRRSHDVMCGGPADPFVTTRPAIRPRRRARRTSRSAGVDLLLILAAVGALAATAVAALHEARTPDPAYGAWSRPL